MPASVVQCWKTALDVSKIQQEYRIRNNQRTDDDKNGGKNGDKNGDNSNYIHSHSIDNQSDDNDDDNDENTSKHFRDCHCDYVLVPTPPRKLAPHHFMHGQLCRVDGFVERYDMYRPRKLHQEILTSECSVDSDDDNDYTHVPQRREVLVAVVHLGRHLAGYPEQLHGGAAALLFDDVVGFAADEVLRDYLQLSAPASPPNAVTAALHVDYVAATPTETTVLLHVRLAHGRGRKLWFVAQLTNVKQTLVYAKARVLYMIPHALL